VSGYSLPHWRRWLDVAGALVAMVLVFVAAPSRAESQEPSSPPCSNVPTLKKSGQPTLPPCPEPEDESTPAESGSRPSLPATAPLLDRAREAAFEFSRKLPNFICQEQMARFGQQGRGQKIPQDMVSAEIIYEDGEESYRNVKVNNRPTDKRLQEIDGSWSTGEFATALLQLFDPSSQAQFRFSHSTTISGLRAQVYDFQVRADHSHWRLSAGSQSVTAAYAGSVWIEPSSARVLRIEMQARDLPSDFPMDAVESAVDYSYVMIEGKSFLLPVHAENLGCQRGSNYCSHNVIDFRNFHQFKGDIKIIP